MKNLIVIALLSFLTIACSKKEEPKIDDLKLLQNDWKIQSVSKDNQDLTEYFSNFEIQINSNNSSTTSFVALNRPIISPFSETGTISQNSSEQLIINMSQGSIVANYNVQSNRLELKFSTTLEFINTSRSSSVDGDWHFIFIK